MGGIALKSYILIGGSSSSVVPSIRGVPHGSILGHDSFMYADTIHLSFYADITFSFDLIF